jgi:hypothetical protein
MLARSGYRCAVAALQLHRPVGHTASVLRIEKVERQHVDTTFGQTTREAADECALLPGACSMREDECRVCVRPGRRGIGKRGRRLVRRNRYRDLCDAAGSRSCILTLLRSLMFGNW